MPSNLKNIAIETPRKTSRDTTAIDQNSLYQLVLSSMEESLAVLDANGKIVAVNRAWTEFARENTQENGDGATQLGVGANYLEVCERAARSDPLAQRALTGIRAVLDGTLDNFRFEYPCHSPATKRFFSMSVTPMKNGEGVVILHTNLTDLVRAKQELEHALDEIAQLKEKLQSENQYLQEMVKSHHNFDEIIGNSEVLRKTLRRIELVAETDSTVLLLGETGTGKERFARAVHARSARKKRPLVLIDCGTLPAGLIESELFGHEKGAFTGAYESKVGRFELAHEGTIFLDEIGELPLDLQANLLRVLEEGEVRRLGSRKERKVDVRVIAATNRDLEKAVAEGKFRADLYYRLSVFPINIPPLRQRREDISALVAFFVTRFAAEVGKKIHSVSKTSLRELGAYDWPGNIRELRNVIERSVILCQGETLELAETLGGSKARRTRPKRKPLKQDLRAIERERILRALDESGWKIKGDGNAASRLGLAPSTLRSKIRALKITRQGDVVGEKDEKPPLESTSTDE